MLTRGEPNFLLCSGVIGNEWEKQDDEAAISIPHTHTHSKEREREEDEQETIEDRNGITRTTFRNVKTSRIKKHVGKILKTKTKKL